MAKNGKQKGARGEREVVSIIQNWWKQIEPNSQFFRTPGSGAFATNHKIEGMKLAGDIMYNPVNTKRFKFSVEVKHREEIKEKSRINFMNNKPSPINKYWEQCKSGAKKDGLEPLLCFRANRMPWYCVRYDKDSGTNIVCEPLSDLVERDPSVYALPELEIECTFSAERMDFGITYYSPEELVKSILSTAKEPMTAIDIIKKAGDKSQVYKGISDLFDKSELEVITEFKYRLKS